MKTVSLKTAIKGIETRIAAVSNRLVAKIKNLPDNPRIKRINTNCFVMSNKHLGDSWSAEFHDYKYQYSKIIDFIKSSKSINIVGVLEKHLDTGYLRIGEVKWKLHPEVIEHVRKVFNS